MAMLIPFKAPACERINKRGKGRMQARSCRICGKQPAQVGNLCQTCRAFVEMEKRKAGKK